MEIFLFPADKRSVSWQHKFSECIYLLRDSSTNVHVKKGLGPILMCGACALKFNFVIRVSTAYGLYFYLQNVSVKGCAFLSSHFYLLISKSGIL